MMKAHRTVNTVLRAQWPAAGYEHIFNAGGENRWKFIFTVPTATVNVSSGQIVRHYDNRNNTKIFLCRARINLKSVLIAYSPFELHSYVLFIYLFMIFMEQVPGISLYPFPEGGVTFPP
jgi:hypothetical protein